jgi:arsenate reductase
MTKKIPVLFLCTHNAARSQMAQAFLRKYGGETFSAHSAGLKPTEIHPMTRKVMKEVGIDLAALGHESKDIYDAYLEPQVHLGYLITVCSNAEANCPIYPGVSERRYWPVQDPAAVEGSEEERMTAFREARDELEARVKAFIEEEAPTNQN